MLRRTPDQLERDEGQKVSLLWWLAVGLILILVAMAIIWAARTTSSSAKADEISLCETTGPSAITAILIDATDPINDVQRLAVRNRLERLVRSVKRNERVDIYTIRSGADLLTPVFSMCRPPRANETSDWTGNKAQAEQRFKEKFKPALDAALAQLINMGASDSSPIMEAVQAASVRSLQAPELATDAEGFSKRLILVSDLLQNSPAGSHLRTLPDWDSFADSAAMRSVASDLSDTDVTIFYLYRDNSAVQGRRHVNFWSAWFGAQGGVVESADPIEG